MKNYLYLLFISVLILTSCSDDASRSSRKTRKKKQSISSRTKKVVEPVVDSGKIEESKKKYSELNLAKIKLKLEYLARKERVSRLTYEQAKTAKIKLADIKDDLVDLNKKMKELEKDLSPSDIAEAKTMPETQISWEDPGITELSVNNITTSDGVEYKGVKLLEVCEIGIDIQHEKGIAFLSYEILPQEIREECSYNPVVAYEFRKRRAEKQKEKNFRLLAEKAEEEKRKKIISVGIKENLAPAKEKESKKKTSASLSSSTIPPLEFKRRKRSIKSSSSSSGCSPKG